MQSKFAILAYRPIARRVVTLAHEARYTCRSRLLERIDADYFPIKGCLFSTTQKAVLLIIHNLFQLIRQFQNS